MALLSSERIEQELKELPGWRLQDKALVKTFHFPRFMQAIDFVNQIAAVAEAADHHPDITINYTRLTFSLSTHDSGGVTEKDLRLAHEIEAAYTSARRAWAKPASGSE